MTPQFVTARNLFSGVVFTVKRNAFTPAKIATWFGEGSCLFAIRSAQPFEISVQTVARFDKEAILRDEETAIFFQ